MGRRLNENLEDSCRIITDYISKENRAEVRELMLKDFLSKRLDLLMANPDIDPVADLESLVSVLGDCFPGDVKRLIAKLPEKTIASQIQETKETVDDVVKEEPTPSGSFTKEAREKIDIAIVTIIPPELQAASLAFGIKINKENMNTDGRRYFRKNIRRPGKKSTLSILLTMVGEPLNVNCAIACLRMFQKYDVQLCILIGIAAGLKEKVKILDVVAADLVLDYEHQRLEPGGRKKRPAQFPLDEEIKRDLQFFTTQQENWKKLFRKCCEKLDEKQIPDSIKKDKFPSYKHGVILAGEKLIADGSLTLLKEEFHDQILAAEEEGSGFCKACRDAKVPWLVFRGISDYGDPKKRKKWQEAAALSAATAALYFLHTNYRTKDERNF